MRSVLEPQNPTVKRKLRQVWPPGYWIVRSKGFIKRMVLVPMKGPFRGGGWGDGFCCLSHLGHLDSALLSAIFSGNSHIPPWGSSENHRLKYAENQGDMLIPWRASFQLFWGDILRFSRKTCSLYPFFFMARNGWVYVFFVWLGKPQDV